MSISQPESSPGGEKNQSVLGSMWCAGNDSQRGWHKRQNHNANQQSPSQDSQKIDNHLNTISLPTPSNARLPRGRGRGAFRAECLTAHWSMNLDNKYISADISNH